MKYDRKNMAIPWNAFWNEVSPVKMSTMLFPYEKHKISWSALTDGGKESRHAFAAGFGLAPLDGVNLLQNSLLRGSQLAIRRNRERRVLHISDGQSRFERLGHHFGFCLHSRDRRGPIGKAPTICSAWLLCVWFRVWLSERLTWSCPPSRPCDALSTPALLLLITPKKPINNRTKRHF